MPSSDSSTSASPDSASDSASESASESASDSAAGAAGNSAAGADRPERRGPPPNPLYHPLFLPVLLVAFSLWFGWDAFLTSDPDMEKHQMFNRVMFFITLPICLWVVPRGIKEHREDQAKAAAAHTQVDGKSD